MSGKKAKMGKWGVEKLREYMERMEEEVVANEDEEGVDNLLSKIRTRFREDSGRNQIEGGGNGGQERTVGYGMCGE